MNTLTLPRPLGFDLDAAQAFFGTFTPGSGMAPTSRHTLALTLSFLSDAFEPVVVRLAQGEGLLRADYVGNVEHAALGTQLGRILGLEADAAAWRALGRRDVLAGRLQREFPGFFTAAKPSPYDAATWAVIAPRMNMTQAARIKIAIARKFGTALDLDGETHHVFPAPRVLAKLTRFDGLSDEKCARLRAVAEAALEGRLGAERLRAMDETAALADLVKIHGVGPWAASHVYYRGAAPVDALPTVEPRVLHGFAALTGEDTPTLEEFRRRTEAWRPFRMWMCVLLSRHLARTARWNDPRLEEERKAHGAALGRTLKRKRAQTAHGSSR